MGTDESRNLACAPWISTIRIIHIFYPQSETQRGSYPRRLPVKLTARSESRNCFFKVSTAQLHPPGLQVQPASIRFSIHHPSLEHIHSRHGCKASLLLLRYQCGLGLDTVADAPRDLGSRDPSCLRWLAPDRLHSSCNISDTESRWRDLVEAIDGGCRSWALGLGRPQCDG